MRSLLSFGSAHRSSVLCVEEIWRQEKGWLCPPHGLRRRLVTDLLSRGSEKLVGWTAGLNAPEDLAPGTYTHNRVWETLSPYVGGEPGSACDLD